MSTKNLDGFILDLRNFSEKIMPKAHADFCKMVAFEVLRGVVFKNPVKTGLSRGNWIVKLDSPVKTPKDKLDKQGSMTVNAGMGVISGARPMHQIIYLTNLISYIGLLENGHSKQAPSGMVELTLNELKMKVESSV